MKFKKYLINDEIINYSHPAVQALSKELAVDCTDEEQIVKNCFTYVRDEIRHSGDHKDNLMAVSASNVLKNKSGWCYSKAILLCALLRANKIPAGLLYQRLGCGEYKDNTYSLHGLNSVYLEKYGWIKIDARGNKEGVDAQFIPPEEKLAFELEEGEFNLAGNYNKPFGDVLKALKTHKAYKDMSKNLPDLNQFICEITKKDAEALSALSGSLLKSIFTVEVPEWFKESFTVEEFENSIASSEYKYYGYVIKNKIAGYIAIKDGNHLYNLFVDEKHQRNGIAKKLWKYMKSNTNFDVMTTNASFNAIAAYKSFGFKISADVQTKEELKYQPMVFKR